MPWRKCNKCGQTNYKSGLTVFDVSKRKGALEGYDFLCESHFEGDAIAVVGGNKRFVISQRFIGQAQAKPRACRK